MDRSVCAAAAAAAAAAVPSCCSSMSTIARRPFSPSGSMTDCSSDSSAAYLRVAATCSTLPLFSSLLPDRALRRRQPASQGGPFRLYSVPCAHHTAGFRCRHSAAATTSGLATTTTESSTTSRRRAGELYGFQHILSVGGSEQGGGGSVETVRVCASKGGGHEEDVGENAGKSSGDERGREKREMAERMKHADARTDSVGEEEEEEEEEETMIHSKSDVSRTGVGTFMMSRGNEPELVTQAEVGRWTSGGEEETGGGLPEPQAKVLRVMTVVIYAIFFVWWLFLLIVFRIIDVPFVNVDILAI